MSEKADIWQGTVALMVLRTLEAMGPLQGYGLARRIEQTSGDLLQLNYGRRYPANKWIPCATSARIAHHD